jgi:hypothetical protein
VSLPITTRFLAGPDDRNTLATAFPMRNETSAVIGNSFTRPRIPSVPNNFIKSLSSTYIHAATHSLESRQFPLNPNSEIEMACELELTTDCTDFTDFFGNALFHLSMRENQFHQVFIISLISAISG